MVAREQRAIAPRPVSAAQNVTAARHVEPALPRRAPAHGLAPLARVPAGRRVLQRFAWPDTKAPDLVAPTFTALRTWADTERCWPLNRTMAEWVARSLANQDVKDAWERFDTAHKAARDPALTKRQLVLAATRLKAHVEKVYESPLTSKEIDEKKANIDHLIRAIPPSVFPGAFDRGKYKDALVKKVIESPRYMQSIKAKDPYVPHLQDDDTSPGGFNATLIKERVDVVRAGGDLMATLRPGADLEWTKWREDDCLFAAILKVLLKKDSPKDEERDRELAERLADDFSIAHGVVDDPVILALMERLGWPHTRYDNWAAFIAGAAKSKLHVLSLDILASGKKSHVVVAYYDGKDKAWKLYDRQAIRLGRTPMAIAPHVDNPLDCWQVTATDAANELTERLRG